MARALGIAVERAPKRPSGAASSGAAHKPPMLRAPLALARAAKVHRPTLDVLVPLVAAKAAAKGLFTH